MLPPTWVDAWMNQRRPKAGSRRIETARIVVIGRNLPRSGLRRSTDSSVDLSSGGQALVAVVAGTGAGLTTPRPDSGECRAAGPKINRVGGASALPSSVAARDRGA